MEASKIIRDLADALDFLHHKGICCSIICVCLGEAVRMLAMAGDCHCYGIVTCVCTLCLLVSLTTIQLIFRLSSPRIIYVDLSEELGGSTG